MITVAVATILAMAALPSFAGLQQRSAIRGAAEQTLSFWDAARFEAVKRNRLVKVGVRTGLDGAFCLGAATTTDEADETPCDCTTAEPGVNACDVARYPADQREWNRVTLLGATLGGSTGLEDLKPVVIEPGRTNLTEPGDAGTISLTAPPGQFSYTINLHVDQLGRALLCESDLSTGQLPDYNGRRCAN